MSAIAKLNSDNFRTNCHIVPHICSNKKDKHYQKIGYNPSDMKIRCLKVSKFEIVLFNVSL